MQIVIDINDEIYKEIWNGKDGWSNYVHGLIRTGTPLPKGHGRLKDEDKIVKAIEDRVEFLKKNDAVFMRLRKDIDILGCIPKIRCEVPTIIEADKEYEVKVITRGNCMMCGKELDEGLFFCKECEAKVQSEDKDADKKCTYKETGCGSCKRQLDCPIEADKAEREKE